MKWIDILGSSLSNLLRRKLRSALTMLGVVIGTTAIVVTISLGYGAEQTQMAALEAQTNLRLVTVNPYYGRSSSSENTSGKRITKITDAVVSRIRAVKGITAVTPIVQVWSSIEFVLKSGKLETSTSVIAVSPRDFAKMMELKNGRFFTGATDKMEFLMSEIAMMEFRDPEKINTDDYWGEDVWTLLYEGKDLTLPPIDWLRAPFTFMLRWEDYENVDENNPDPKVYTKEYKARFMGTIKTNLQDWTFNYGAIINLNYLKKLQRDNRALFKEYNLPDFKSYDYVHVLADSVDNVADVTKELNEMGLMAYSPLEYVQQYKEQIQTVQGFLGFIGAISMFVAALSIANTMMMSIYERTREIGVMKVLGCKLGNIRLMFLSEAAYIGIFGGAFGLMLSYLLSYLLNNVEALQVLVSSIMSSTAIFSSDASSTSIIPSSLAMTTWFSVVAISTLSGLYPAQRAMQLSSLAAIRNAD